MKQCSMVLFCFLFWMVHAHLQAVDSLMTSNRLNETLLVTYGSDAKSIEGDDDYVQVLFIRIPDAIDTPLSIQLYDPDCGGAHDARYQFDWNTRTRFRLYGGIGAYSTPEVQTASPSKKVLETGELLADVTFGEHSDTDGQWYLYTTIRPEQGERIESNRYFRLVIEGQEGDDGNRYDVRISVDEERKAILKEVSLFTFSPTLHIPEKGKYIEMRFFIPADVPEITVHNFDFARASVKLDTAYRSGLRVRTSGQNEWVSMTFQLDPLETGRYCALRVEGGDEMPNDVSFYLTDPAGKLLPTVIPPSVWIPNYLPEIGLTWDTLEDCVSIRFDASSTVDADNDALSFYWDFGDGATGEGAQIVHRYDEPGRYSILLRAEDDSGHLSFGSLKRLTVPINAPPVPAKGNDRSIALGDRISFDASDSLDPDGTLIRFQWDFGDGNRSEKKKTQHVYKAPGTYDVTLTVEDDSGSPCRIATNRFRVRVNAQPIPEIETAKIGSPNETMRFSAMKSVDPDGAIIQYVWDFGDGMSGNGAEIEHTYEKPGTYKVTLSILDDSNVANSSATASLSVKVNHHPIATAGKDQRSSVGEPVEFDASGSSDPDGSIVSYHWDFGDGSEQSSIVSQKTKSEKISHRYEKSGTYRAVLTVQDDSDSTSNQAQDEITVFINAPPVADAGPDQRVTDSLVRFDGSRSDDPDGEIVVYSWDFGDGSTGSGQTSEHIYKSPGTYTVHLTVTDDSGTSSNRATDSLIVIINDLPVADAGPNRIGIPDQALHFDGSGSVDPDGSIIRYTWDFGEGTVQEGKTVSHAFQKPGGYHVLLKVHDDSGQDEAVGFDEAIIKINSSPIANAGADQVVVPGDRVFFDGTHSYDTDGEIRAYRWEFSDGSVFDTAKVEHSFDAPGIYSGTLTVTDNLRVENSIGQDTVMIRVNHMPQADAGTSFQTADRTILFNGSNSVDADGDSLKLIWDFGDGSPKVIGEKVFYTYQKGGSYPVILTVDDGTGLKNAVSKTSITVMINEPPIADAGENMTACSGKPILFDGSGSRDPEGGVLKYHWDFGDQTDANVMNPTKIYTTGGVYPVTLTVTDDSGLQDANSAQDQIVIKVVESPVANAGEDHEVCSGQIVQFDGTASKDVDGLVNSFEWDFGDGTQGGGPNPIHVYSKAGIYRVRLTITGDNVGGCVHMDTDYVTVTVNEAPKAILTGPAEIELGKMAQFEANLIKDSKPIMQWNWDLGDGTFAQGRLITHLYNRPGTFVVALTVISESEMDCNTTTIRKQVFVNQSPVAKIGTESMTHILAGTYQPIFFNGALSEDPDGAITSYTWDFGDGTTAQGIQMWHSYPNPGKYTVQLTVKDNTNLDNNTASDTFLVTVNDSPKPAIDLISNESLSHEAPYILCPTQEVGISGKRSTDTDGEILSYSWSFGDKTPFKEGKNVTHSWMIPGNYWVELEVNDGRSAMNSLSCIGTWISVNAPPLAKISATPIVSPEISVRFDGTESIDPDGAIESYLWDFGDGDRSEGKQTSHQFRSPGTYEVHLLVTDNSGTSCNTGEAVFPIRVNASPVARAGGDRIAYYGGANDNIVFDASASYDPDDDPLTYRWDFGDGSQANGKIVRHTYSKVKRYRVTLTVDDGTGLSSGIATDRITIDVQKRK